CCWFGASVGHAGACACAGAAHSAMNETAKTAEARGKVRGTSRQQKVRRRARAVISQNPSVGAAPGLDTGSAVEVNVAMAAERGRVGAKYEIQTLTARKIRRERGAKTSQLCGKLPRLPASKAPARELPPYSAIDRGIRRGGTRGDARGGVYGKESEEA